MLKNRILSTLRFFELQDWPLTLFELHRFLVADIKTLRARVNTEYEIIGEDTKNESVDIAEVLHCLGTECQKEVESLNGFYCLKGKTELVRKRLENYSFGITREKSIRKYTWFIKYIPFIRGVALGGSQAMGRQASGSDIDLLIITDKDFLGLARSLITGFFQILGVRRHGKYVANRFCLNHYLVGPKVITELKNLYSAMEYGRLRPLVYGEIISLFQNNNAFWIKQCFPNWEPALALKTSQSRIQKALEKIFTNRFGLTLEKFVKSWQVARIKKEKFILVENDELSFHPESKQGPLLSAFFENQS